MKETLVGLMEFCLGLGAEYADVRVKDIWTQSVSADDGKMKNLSSSRSRGAGIRVFVGGSVGFAATNDLERLEETARRAFEIAKVSGILQSEKIKLAAKPVVVDTYNTPVEKDPEGVALADKIALLLKCEEIMQGVEGTCVHLQNMLYYPYGYYE